MGTSTLQDFFDVVNKDHPHAYGDKLKSVKACVGTLGSSPRVWGQVAQINSLEKEGRIIPTRMGTSNNISVVKLAN